MIIDNIGTNPVAEKETNACILTSHSHVSGPPL